MSLCSFFITVFITGLLLSNPDDQSGRGFKLLDQITA
uniref:Uncharacterized protein n=1 Tax=Anguilla anguilla TaxID=7936 RepID=A0A0E9R895_ANGAN